MSMWQRQEIQEVLWKMIRPYDFGIGPIIYCDFGINNSFPNFPCGKCLRWDKLKKNGYHWRYVIGPDTGGEALLIPIRVLYCRRCHKITYILPSFCVPRKQHTVLAFESFFLYLFCTKLSLTQVAERARRIKSSYQLAQAWIKSFRNNVVNLTAEVRTIMKVTDNNDSCYRCIELSSLWWSLQKLADDLSPQFPGMLPLERVQWILMQKRRLSLFSYIA